MGCKSETATPKSRNYGFTSITHHPKITIPTPTIVGSILTSTSQPETETDTEPSIGNSTRKSNSSSLPATLLSAPDIFDIIGKQIQLFSKYLYPSVPYGALLSSSSSPPTASICSYLNNKYRYHFHNITNLVISKQNKISCEDAKRIQHNADSSNRVETINLSLPSIQSTKYLFDECIRVGHYVTSNLLKYNQDESISRRKSGGILSSSNNDMRLTRQMEHAALIAETHKANVTTATTTSNRSSTNFSTASSIFLVLCYLTSFTSAAVTDHPIFDESSSDKEILDHLLQKTRYDKRLLPPVNGTLTVNVNVLLLSLASPDESSLKYEVEFLLNQQWNDPRLQYGNKSEYDYLNALHHHDNIWTPDTYFIMHGDFKDPIIPMHFALRIYRNGTITYAMRRHLILSCQGSLHIFPFDDPKCSFSMESISYELSHIKYVWKNDEDTLRKSPSLTTLNAYLIQNATVTCSVKSWRGVTTMLNFFTTSNGFRGTLPVVSNLTAMNVWDGVCMCFIYASLLEFVCVNYVGRKRPLHNVVYRPGENPVTQRLPAVLSRIGVILASPLEVIEREFHAALSSEKGATAPPSPMSRRASRMHFPNISHLQQIRSMSASHSTIIDTSGLQEPVFVETLEQTYSDPTTLTEFRGRQERSMGTNTPPLLVGGRRVSPNIRVDNTSDVGIELTENHSPIKPPRRKSSRPSTPSTGQDVEASTGDINMVQNTGEKKRDTGGPNEIVACTNCAGGSSPCTHSANNGCATETCFVQVRKKEPPHPIRVAKTIDVIARITFPTAYAIFLIFFFVHYKGFS